MAVRNPSPVPGLPLSPLGNASLAFFAGHAELIGRACSGHHWDSLLAGDYSVAHIVFPPYVHCLHALLMWEAVLGEPYESLVNDVHKVAGIEGYWSAEVVPEDLVAALADVTEPRELRLRWMEMHIRENVPAGQEELVVPKWSSKEMLHATSELIDLAHIAFLDSFAVVEISVQ